MPKYSLTQAGVAFAVVGTLLVQFGFSESCSNEIVQVAPTLIGSVIAWIGRYRHGDVTIAGFRKPIPY